MTEFDEWPEEDDFFEEESELTPEEIFKMVMINRVKGTTVHVKLFDKDQDEILLSDIIENLLSYIQKQLSKEDSNQYTDQIMPLMAQTVVSGLGRYLGINHTAFFLADKTLRMSLINMMSISFLLLKYVQQKEIVIQTFEEEISEEEIEEIERKAKAGDVATVGAFLGMDPKEILKDLFEKGEISQTDLDSFFDNEED